MYNTVVNLNERDYGMNTDRFFTCAKHMAEMSDFDRQKMGCVAVYKKKIVSVGFNTTKTHPLQKEYNKLRFEGDFSPHCMHAEIHTLNAIKDSNIDWSRVKVFIYRICKKDKDKSALARPCPSCMAYMKKLGIKHIYYTTLDGPVHEVLDLD